MRLRTKNNSRVIHRFALGLLCIFGILILLTSCRPKLSLVSFEDASSLHRRLDENRETPAGLLAEELSAGRSIVLVQDDLLRADTVDLMRSLIPILYDLGIREIGLFFLNTINQEELDRFVVNGDDVTRAGKLLFSADAALGYLEYCDFMIYVQDFNQRLLPDETPMRLLALGEDGKVSPELLALSLGLAEESTGEGSPAENEVKPPVFLWIPAEDLGLLPAIPETENGDGVETVENPEVRQSPVIIAHHGPGKGYLRWSGLIESVAAERDIRDRTFAFRTAEPPFSGWSYEEAGIESEIYLVTPYSYRAVEPIPDFITSETAAEALVFFPDISMEKPLSWVASRMNRITKRAARQYDRMIEKLEM